MLTGLPRRYADGGYEAVAVAFLHSYTNPAHETAMREVLKEVAPGLDVSISSDLSREYREYERTSTAVLDAYIKPIVRTYLYDLGAELEAGGFEGRFLMMRSGGGAMTASSARENPVNLILSGPAGGVIGAAGFARMIGEPNLITVDMGGTSLDASLVIEGQPVMHQGAEFESLPINISSLYIHTIGAGGGSIAWTDEAGGLQVGPHSAGADPGPASYGSGGSEATFTDAALVVGYLGQETPLGGTLTLDEDLARRVLEPLAKSMGLPVEELALGVVRISAVKVMGAVRSITVELGPRPEGLRPAGVRRRRGDSGGRRGPRVGYGHCHHPAGPGRLLRARDVDGRRPARLRADRRDAARVSRRRSARTLVRRDVRPSSRYAAVGGLSGREAGVGALGRRQVLRPGTSGVDHPPGRDSRPDRISGKAVRRTPPSPVRPYDDRSGGGHDAASERHRDGGSTQVAATSRREAGLPEPFATRPVLDAGAPTGPLPGYTGGRTSAVMTRSPDRR